jgi:hypothetical protein
VYTRAPRDVVRGCHDALSALAVIIVDVEFLGERLASDREAVEVADEVRRSVDRITDIVRLIQREAHELALTHDGSGR